MPQRRILSLWFPRLAAERCLRQGFGLPGVPFAVVGEDHNAQVLVSLSAEGRESSIDGMVAAGYSLRRTYVLLDAEKVILLVWSWHL